MMNNNLSFNYKAITIKFLQVSWAHCQRTGILSVNPFPKKKEK